LLQVSLKDYGKKAVENAIEALVSEGKVIQKDFGKQKVFWWKQDDLPGGDDGLKNLDETIKQLKEELASTQEEVKKLTAENKSLESTLSNEELEERIKTLTKEVLESSL